MYRGDRVRREVRAVSMIPIESKSLPRWGSKSVLFLTG
jgi:hypothetical protein